MKSLEQQSREILVRMGIEGAESMTSGEVVEISNLLNEVAKLRNQRDLAVGALEHIARSLPQIGVERVWMMDHANKVLSTIKESEAMAQAEHPE